MMPTRLSQVLLSKALATAPSQNVRPPPTKVALVPNRVTPAAPVQPPKNATVGPAPQQPTKPATDTGRPPATLVWPPGNGAKGTELSKFDFELKKIYDGDIFLEMLVKGTDRRYMKYVHC